MLVVVLVVVLLVLLVVSGGVVTVVAGRQRAVQARPAERPATDVHGFRPQLHLSLSRIQLVLVLLLVMVLVLVLVFVLEYDCVTTVLSVCVFQQNQRYTLSFVVCILLRSKRVRR